MVAPVLAPAVVSASGLVKSFHRGSEVVRALRGADLTVAQGQLVGISGASGSGKSTLLAVLCGWESPEAGTLQVAGTDSPRSLPWARLALLPQTLGLLDDLPALENVLLPARLAGRQSQYRDRARELMDRLGVGHLGARFADQVSLGEQQRIAVARTVLLRPDLVLVDEPTAHQDARFGDVVLDLLREYVDGGGAAVLVSHHRQALDRADTVLHMADGVLS